jgi:hypothetical protein
VQRRPTVPLQLRATRPAHPEFYVPLIVIGHQRAGGAWARSARQLEAWVRLDRRIRALQLPRHRQEVGADAEHGRLGLELPSEAQ